MIKLKVWSIILTILYCQWFLSFSFYALGNKCDTPERIIIFIVWIAPIILPICLWASYSRKKKLDTLGLGKEYYGWPGKKLYELADSIYDTNKPMAIKLLALSMRKKYPDAFALYGEAIFDSNQRAGIRSLKKGEKLKSKSALMYLISLYLNKERGAYNPRKALKYMKKGEKLDIPEIYYLLGIFYINGIAHKKDLNKSIYYLKKAVNLGNKDAEEYYKQALLDKYGKNYLDKYEISDSNIVYDDFKTKDNKIDSKAKQEKEDESLFFDLK